ncbi:MAG TPA: PTS glucose transporter subunit IIA [Neobacillus sp.]|jgi:PTS system glucose-specific IIA component
MRLNPFKKAKLQIYSPVNGKIIPIEEVPDPVFSQKMMGEGVAFIPAQGNICAPVNGTIIQIAPTKHAIGIRAEDGSEILIHVGLETVSLKGEGFKVAVNLDEKVTVGQQLLEVDWDYIRTHAKSIVTPLVITNSHEGKKQFAITEEKEGVIGKTVILTVSAN